MSQLIFVYNADSGLFNTLTDIAHKIISPSTYSCNLCSLTHSYFAVKKDWTEFLSGIDAELEFLHKDELIEKYGPSNISLPVIFLYRDKQLQEWITTAEINACSRIEDLKTLIVTKLKASSPD